MNIVIVSTFDTVGGAPIAAHRLFHGLRSLNHNAVMLVKKKSNSNKEPNTFVAVADDPADVEEKDIFHVMERLAISENRTDFSNTYFSIPYPGMALHHLDIIRNADIINLHWVAGYLSVESVAALLELGKPVVWTLHDENTYTGGCHYTAGCDKYTSASGCEDCPQLRDNRHQVPYHVLRNKIKRWNKNLSIVTPSHWLARCAQKSRLLKKNPIQVIPNAVDTSRFKPRSKEEARKRLGLSQGVIYLLFGAHTDNEKRKGFAMMMEALRFCLEDRRFKDMAQKGTLSLLTFGPPQADLENLGIPIASTGYIKDECTLADVYSAAHIFVLPSLEDNLPNTMLEAMACGVPVTGFRVGGLPDMIRDGVTGYTAPCFDCRGLGENILKLVFEEEKYRQMAHNCRQLMVTGYKLKDQAQNYLELFAERLGDKKAAEPGAAPPAGNSQRIRIPGRHHPEVQPEFFDLFRVAALHVLKFRTHLLKAAKRRIKSKWIALVKKILHKFRRGDES